jgi:hypothetical protein
MLRPAIDGSETRNPLPALPRVTRRREDRVSSSRTEFNEATKMTDLISREIRRA